MKVSINHEIRFNLKNEFIETFFLTNQKQLVEKTRQIIDILEYIAYRFSIIEIENIIKTKVNLFTIEHTYQIDKFPMPFVKREFTFDYLPTVSKYHCNKCEHHSNKGICLLRGKYTKGIWKNCIYYLEKLNAKNFKIIEYK